MTGKLQDTQEKGSIELHYWFLKGLRSFNSIGEYGSFKDDNLVVLT